MESIDMSLHSKSTNYPIVLGLICGLTMTLILFMFQLSGNDYAPGMKLVTYFALFVFISVGLFQVKGNSKKAVFFDGIYAGIKLTTAAALTIVAINILLFLILPDYAFSKYTILPDTVGKMLAISAILFFETFVFGNIISFMTMQALKNGKNPADNN